MICPSCGTDLPEGSRFCLQCGAALDAAVAHPEERKVVTTLICDLVGFTALTERTDPEDVDALLRRHNDMARRIVESYGGIVEKFIGDAVVAVFGVPTVHEDDPERAVRAGLRIVEEAERTPGLGDDPLTLRVGVNTGEALVRLDVTPGSGEGFLTGDSVNTAARLQGIASPMSVVVGEPTYELTRRAFEYEALEPISVKGKGEPLDAWRALTPLARTGARRLDQATPLVGRQVELSYLTALFDKAADSASPQVALVVGEPGIGKSRLVAELFARVDAGERVATWRQGACLPYGEGVTFWALAEILKAHAGILETDDGEQVGAKLDAVLPAGEDHEWFRQRLRALLGLDAAKAEREENFTAWLRFLEDVASRGPTVLVIEDLHWGDDALLAFVEYFASHVADVPLFLVATARPELFEAHPAFAATGHVNRVVLEPLSSRETESLVDSLLEEITADVRATIARHSEGNPFYAEESARLVKDRVAVGRLGQESATVAATVQAVIAARLDTLPPELKAVLADASVVGQVFWDGALVALGERSTGDVEDALNELIARRLVHRVRTSSMAGEREFAFGHALARDVAYGELPRAARARKHAAVAGWLEQKAGARVEDLAEILAHHYATALELAGAAGAAELSGELAGPAVRYLTLAGDRAWPLDVAAAERHYARALGIAGPDSPRRSALLVKWAQATAQLGREAEAVGPLEEAIDRLRAEGDLRSAAVAQLWLARVLPGDEGALSLELCDDGVALLEADGPSRELVAVLADWLDLTAGRGASQKHLEVAGRAMGLSDQLGLPADPRLLVSRGCARCDLGDAGGLEDFRQALEMCRSSELREHVSSVYAGVANWIYMYEGFDASLTVAAEGAAFARRRGALDTEAENRGVIVWASQGAGDWDTVLDEAVALEPLFDVGGPLSSFSIHRDYVRLFRTLVLVERGRASEAAKMADWLEERATLRESLVSAGVCIAAAAARMALGDSVRALDLLTRGDAALRGAGGFWFASLLPHAMRIALSAGDLNLAEKLAGSLEPTLQPLAEHATATARALVDEARGDHEAAAAGFADAAARWHDFAAVYEEAHALLGQGRCLMALGRAPEAAPVLEQAREIFARLEAKPALEETDLLLSQTARGGPAAARRATAPDGDGPPANGPEPDSKG